MIFNILWGIPQTASIGTLILKILLLVFILGIIILIHEFGHFMWAKKFDVHIYEFSIGMGPLLKSHKGKDGINYNIRWIPIGGYVAMAGEVYDDDDKIDKSRLLCNKPWWQRLIIMVAGVFNNFVLTIVLLFVYGAIWGGVLTPVVDKVVEDLPASQTNIKANDQILSINGYKVNSWDKAQIILAFKNKTGEYTFKVKHENGQIEDVKITPEVVKNGDTESKVFGIAIKEYKIKNIWNVIVFGFKKFGAILSAMWYTIYGLVAGKISLDSLSGPVGMYTVIGQTFGYSLSEAIGYVVYLILYISTNVGLINILPFPAFDGGHVLFIIIEKIKGSPVNAKIENTCHLIGFALIFLLMIIVTINDIIKLF